MKNSSYSEKLSHRKSMSASKTADDALSLHSKSTVSGVNIHKDSATINKLAPRPSQGQESMADILKSIRSSYSVPSSPTSLNSSIFPTDHIHFAEAALYDAKSSAALSTGINDSSMVAPSSSAEPSTASGLDTTFGMMRQNESTYSVASSAVSSESGVVPVIPVSTNTSMANIDHLIPATPMNYEVSGASSIDSRDTSTKPSQQRAGSTADSTSFHHYLESVNAYLATHNK